MAHNLFDPMNQWFLGMAHDPEQTTPETKAEYMRMLIDLMRDHSEALHCRIESATLWLDLNSPQSCKDVTFKLFVNGIEIDPLTEQMSGCPFKIN